ncbi:hypothetical protein HOY82DRAFT_541548 [Tuber indicum]|nr:hypothetical protein HOY82DRAFT_541548 [Tuber indicum]
MLEPNPMYHMMENCQQTNGHPSGPLHHHQPPPRVPPPSKQRKYQTTTGETNAMTRSQNYFTEIGMAQEQCHELKVYIKCMILPGAPAFECYGLGDKESKTAYNQWFNNALEEIGPRIFPLGGKGLAWPEDYVGIYMTVHEVVQLLSTGIGDDCGETDNSGAVEKMTEGCDEMEMTQNDEISEGECAGDTDLEEIAQDEQEDQVMVMDKDYKNKDAMEQGTNMNNCSLKPEVFGHFPSLAEGCFDWDEVVGSISPESLSTKASPPRFFNTRGGIIPPLTHLISITVDLSRWGLENVLAK